MRLTVIGSGAGGTISQHRGQSALALRLDDGIWIFDAGEGTTLNIIRHGLFKLSHITRIFITHMHPDHTFGLCGLLSQLEAFKSTDTPVEIYGPADLRTLINTTLTLTRAHGNRKYRIHRLLRAKDEPRTGALAANEMEGRDIEQTGDHWTLWEDDKFKVQAASILHTIDCFGYAMTEQPAASKLDMAKIGPLLDANALDLAKQGIDRPITLLGQLQRERKPITLPSGDVLEPPPLGKPGRKIVVLGDTYDASGAIGISQDATVVVHECTNVCSKQDEVSGKTRDEVRKLAADRGHSTPQVAGAFAKAVKARFLLLNHVSTRYTPRDREPLLCMAAQAKEEAGCDVIVARDQMTIEVFRPDGDEQLIRLERSQRRPGAARSSDGTSE